MLFPKREWWSHIERIKDVERGHHLFTVGLQFLILFLSTSPITNLQFCKISHYSPVKFNPFFLEVIQIGLCNLQSKRIQDPKASFCPYNEIQRPLLDLLTPSGPAFLSHLIFFKSLFYFLLQNRWSLLAKLSNWCFPSNLYMAFVLGLVYSVSRYFLAGFPREINLQLCRLGCFFLTTLIKYLSPYHSTQHYSVLLKVLS